MTNQEIEKVLKYQKEYYQKLYDRFEVGEEVEYYSDHFNQNMIGKIVKKKLGDYGVDLRVDLDGGTTLFWINAEDVI